MVDVADLQIRSSVEGADKTKDDLRGIAREGKAAEGATDNFSAAMKRAAREAEKAAADQEKAVARATRAHEANLERAAASQQRVMRATQRAGLDLTRQFSDIGVSIAGGMPIWMVLTQQLPQISDGLTVAKQSGVNFREALMAMLRSVSLVGVGIGILIVALTALAALWLKGESDALSFERSVTGLGRASGISAQHLKAFADENAAAGDVSLNAARKMAIAYNNTGVVGATVMGRLIRITKDYGSVMGMDATEATEALGDAMKSPDDAGRALTRTMGLLTQEQLKQIDAAMKAGDQMKAQTILIGALEDAMAGHAEKAGTISNAWDAIATSISNAITKLGEFLYITESEKVANLERELSTRNGIDRTLGQGELGQTDYRDRRQDELDELRFGRLRRTWTSSNQAIQAQRNQRAQQIVDNADPARRTRTPGKSEEEKEYDRIIAASERLVAQLNDEAKTYGGGWEAIARYNSAQQVAAMAANGWTTEETQLATAIMDATEAMITRRKLMDGEKMDKADDIRLQSLDVPKLEIITVAELTRDAFRDIDDAALDLGASLQNTFGAAGASLGQLLSNFTDYRAEMAQIALDAEKGSITEEKATRQRGILEAKTYADMAGAAKGFFDEKSKGYQILQAVEMTYRAFQAAASISSMVRDALETTSTVANAGTKAAASTAAGGAKMFEQLGVWAFPLVGAMVAVMAGLGMGGGGSVSMPSLPQTNLGQGTVLGDQNAESESLRNSLDRAEQYQNKDLEYSNKMIDALRAIQSNIGRVTDAISRQMNLGGGLDSSKLNLGTSTGGGFLGIGSTTRTAALAGSGIDLNGGTLAELISRGVTGSMYQLIENTKTKSGFLGIGGKTTSWVSENRTDIDGDLSRELTRVVTSLREGVLSAAAELGITGSEATLDALTIELGRIDFEGMSSDEISDRLNAVFSAAGDRMAEAVLPTLARYQQAGEGMLETMTRLATMMRSVDTVLTSLGMSFGPVGIESLEARNRLVELSGGLDAFIDGASSFADAFLTDAQRIAPVQAAVTRELARLGIAATIGRTEFANLVLGLDVSTEAGASMYAALIRLAPALDQVITYQDELNGVVADAADLARQRRDLEIQLMEAMGDTAGATAARRHDELEAMDASMRPLQLLVWARLDLNAAEEAAAQLASTRRDLEIRLMDASGNAAGVLAARRELEMKAMDEALRPLLRLIYAQEDLNAANDNAATAAEEAAERAALLQSYRDQQEGDAKALLAEAQDRLVEAHARERDAIQVTIDKFRNFERSLRAFRESLSTEGLSPGDSMAATKAEFDRIAALAKLGDEEALEKLQGVSEAQLLNAKQYSRSSLEYLMQVAEVRNAVEAAEEAAARHASIGDQQLAVLNASVAGLITINSSVMSVRDAILAVQSAQSVVNAATPTVNNPNREWGVNPEANRLLARQTGYDGDFGGGGWQAWIEQQPESIKALGRQILAAQGQSYRIAFADGGAFTNGIVHQPMLFNMGLMGEKGSEAIMPLVNGPNGLGVRSFGANDDDVVMLLQDISAKLDDLNAAGRQTTVNTGRMARSNESIRDDTDRVVNGGESITTVAA